MRQKILGAGIAAVLVSLAAVGVFASQDGVNLLDVPTETPTDTPVVGDTATVTATPTATGTPSATATPSATDTPTGTATPGGTETPTVTATPTASTTPDDGEDGEDGDTHGIPSSNPNHHPEDGDGVCEHGETIVKTTPSGNHVNVPCQTQKHDSKVKHHDDD